MTESTPEGKWSRLNDVEVIELMLIDTTSEHWVVCAEYVENYIRWKFPNLSWDAQNDATQDAMLAVHRKLSTFRQECKLTTWLTYVARNNAINEVRKQKAALEKEIRYENTAEDDEDNSIEQQMVSTFKTPEEMALLNEQTREIYATLEDFLSPNNSPSRGQAWSERNREILQMVLIDDARQEKTARKLGIAPANIGYMVRKAREYLEEKGLNPYQKVDKKRSKADE